MTFTTKLIAAASALTVAGAMIAAVPFSAYAAPVPVGSCTGQLLLLRSTPALTDQTQLSLTERGGLARDRHTLAKIAGSCTDSARTNDPQIAQPTGPLTPETASLSLMGNASCASTPDAQTADANANSQYALTGRVLIYMKESYRDPVTGFSHRYHIEARITVLGTNLELGPDVIDVRGIVLTGTTIKPSLSPGAIVTGSIWEDPVTFTRGTTGYNTGYELDLNDAAACADSQPNNAIVGQMLSGTGGVSQPSLLGSTASGLLFSLGE